LLTDQDDPSTKLYMFQFPTLFPNYIPKAPVDMTGNGETKPDVKPDVKPDLSKLTGPAGRKKKPQHPEGRVGSLVVMKSGKVKVVMGDDIVMNVSVTFLSDRYLAAGQDPS
jgi:DNA-directed RNA polymerase III subunit RPC4